jgi:hypothetical protein
MLWPHPAQQPRIGEIRNNLTARISEAEREGWHGEVEGLKISLAGANDKLAQIDRRASRRPVHLGFPAIPSPRQPASRMPVSPRQHRMSKFRPDSASKWVTQALKCR